MPDLTIEERLAELETQVARKLTLKDLPLKALQDRLHQDWQPEGDNLLLPKSVGPPSLELEAQQAFASDGGGGISLTLSTTSTDIPGCSIAAPSDGIYLAMGIFDFSVAAAGGVVCLGSCLMNGVDQGAPAVMVDAATRVTTPQHWLGTVPLKAGQIIKLRASKQVAAGTSRVFATQTKLTVLGPL